MQCRRDKCFPVNCFGFSLVLLFCYFILPIITFDMLGDDFYIFSSYQRKATPLVLTMFFILTPFLFTPLVFKGNYCSEYIPNKIFLRVFKVCFYLSLLLIISMFFNGLYLRWFTGADREILLEGMHKFLFSGVSFIFLAGFYFASKYTTRNAFIVFCVLLILIDVVYMGKKFSFYLIAMVLFRFDSSVKRTVKPLMCVLIFGLLMVIITYLLRALFINADAVQLNIYSVISEFSGVFASTGFSLQYGSSISEFFNINQYLEYHYISQVGHGLALHPFSYFYIISPMCWQWIFLFFLISVFLIFSIASYIILDMVVFVLMFNIIHFFRHGPDIFLQQSLTQLFFLILIVVFCDFFSLKKGVRDAF